jgi:hypothetical protein
VNEQWGCQANPYGGEILGIWIASFLTRSRSARVLARDVSKSVAFFPSVMQEFAHTHDAP